MICLNVVFCGFDLFLLAVYLVFGFDLWLIVWLLDGLDLGYEQLVMFCFCIVGLLRLLAGGFTWLIVACYCLFLLVCFVFIL